MRTRLLTDRGTARGRRSPLPTPSASPSARVKTTGRHQVSSSAASASCSAGSGVLRQAGPAGLARRHRRLLCPRGRVFMTGRSGTGTSLAADRRARQPSRGHRLAGLKRGRPAGRRIPHAGPGSRSDAGPPQGHQQGDAVRRGMHLEPLEGYDLFDAIVLLAAPIAVIPDHVANATTTRTSSPRANARRSSRARPGRAAPPPFGYRRDRHHVSPRRRGRDARDHHSP